MARRTGVKFEVYDVALGRIGGWKLDSVSNNPRSLLGLLVKFHEHRKFQYPNPFPAPFLVGRRSLLIENIEQIFRHPQHAASIVSYNMGQVFFVRIDGFLT